MNQVFQLELYPIPLPSTCKVLREDEILESVLAQSKGKVPGETPAIQKQQLNAYTNHFEVIVVPTFQWETAFHLLQDSFQDFVWTRVGIESVGHYDIYSFEFIPLTVTKENLLSFSMGQYLKQHYPGESDSKVLIKEVNQLLNQKVCWQEKEVATQENFETLTPVYNEEITDGESRRTTDSSWENVIEKQELQSTKETSQLPEVLRELKNARNAKERMSLANQKLEILLTQIENYNMNRAIDDLIAEDYVDENWDKRLKINLREYTILMQKSKFLEQLWLVNRDLETQIERMTISDTHWVYEREQVKRLKERLSTHEVYLVLDECHEIEKRCKIRTRVLWGSPYVRIMQMDYDSLRRKAQYFDLLQGENVVLDQMVKEDAPPV